MMRFYIYAIALSACASAGAVQSDTSLSESEAQEIYFECLETQATRIDDGLTEPSVLGMEVATACTAERNALRDVIVETVPDQNKLSVRESLDAEMRSNASTMGFVAIIKNRGAGESSAAESQGAGAP